MLDLEKLRKLVIIALFTDDDLYDTFVLKGGNALLIHSINKRGSTDVDVSMPDEFKDEELNSIQEKLQKALEITFDKEGYSVIDVKLLKSPAKISEEKKKFWGGYSLEFKVVSKENKEKYKDDLQKLRQVAEIIDLQQKKKFKVDISKFEYCEPKIETEIDGFPIYVYTPLMLVYEKLRAICQQHEEYVDFVVTNRRPRPRDFFDIYTILEHSPKLKDKMIKEENLKDLVEIFILKRVPLDFLEKIRNYREFHRQEFSSVVSTVYPGVKIESYDFYFDQVLKISEIIAEALITLDMMDNITANA